MKKYCFGVDVGGTTVKVGLFTVEGQLLDKWEIITRTENNGENILFDICESLEAKLDEKSIDLDEVKGIGIGLPGPVLDDGTVLQCVNLGWGKFNVSEKMSEMFHGIEVKVGNDANVAALGEAWKGGGKNFDDIVMVTLGTGVGGGVILEGKILTGHNGAAGEIGHMHVEDGEELNCNCGGCGCLEQYASATGVVRLANRYIAKNSESTKMTEFGEDITAKDVFDLAKEGDKGAVAVVEQMSTYLGKAMASIATVVNPQAFIIGEDFIGDDTVAMILGDNIFAGHGLKKRLCAAVKNAENGNGATVFGYYVDDPERFGIVEFDRNGKAVSIEEKPSHPKSNYCVTGLYFYDNRVVEYAKNLTPSARGELEITDLNRIYLENNSLNVELLGQGFTWLDTGTHESLVDATNFVKTMEQHQHRKIACLEEIAYLNGWISKEEVLKVYEVLKKNEYGQYLKDVLDGKYQENLY